MDNSEHSRQNFDHLGWLMLRGAVSSEHVQRLKNAAGANGRPGVREAPENALGQAIDTSGVIDLLQGIWPSMRLVRLLSFDKSAEANWGVPWHQDRVISVVDRAEVPGFTNWSCKGGTWHCEPPEELLQQMLFVRLHLDDNCSENGAMQIVPGSHSLGKVPVSDVGTRTYEGKPKVIEARAGDILVLKMLTLHGSEPAQTPTRRRVLRLDFAPFELPHPLAWA
ncbi:phytanoyl-CoA dioxygenase family protein [Halocynthiibacter sp.]|uniref:phytanoyl-CoA dioxygenase family protein n=1 Tax=Halocynthiibacter sp. TaxID=1979210 RepID=UPI003C5032C0